MAERYLVSSGNSNNPLIYDGGGLPAPDDILRLNGYTLTQNSNIVLSELRNDANPSQGVVSGGFLTVSTTGFTTVSDVYYHGGNYIYLVSADIVHTLIGKVVSNFYSSSRGLYFNNNFYGKMTIVGDIVANLGLAIGSVAPVGGRLEVFGNLYNSANNSTALASGNLEVTVNGLAYGAKSTLPIINQSGGTAGSVKVQGAIMSLGGTNLFAGDVRFMSNPLFVVIDESGSPLPLTDPNTADHALPQDVRFDVVYNNGGLVGTSKMPVKEVVSKGVVFDNGTVGEAILTAEAVAQAAAQVVGAQFNSFK